MLRSMTSVDKIMCLLFTNVRETINAISEIIAVPFNGRTQHGYAYRAL